eukprot:scaffold13676_cov138-Isochrysis_galbana.AAC.4
MPCLLARALPLPVSPSAGPADDAHCCQRQTSAKRRSLRQRQIRLGPKPLCVERNPERLWHISRALPAAAGQVDAPGFPQLPRLAIEHADALAEAQRARVEELDTAQPCGPAGCVRVAVHCCHNPVLCLGGGEDVSHCRAAGLDGLRTHSRRARLVRHGGGDAAGAGARGPAVRQQQQRAGALPQPEDGRGEASAQPQPPKARGGGRGRLGGEAGRAGRDPHARPQGKSRAVDPALASFSSNGYLGQTVTPPSVATLEPPQPPRASPGRTSTVRPWTLCAPSTARELCGLLPLKRASGSWFPGTK